MSDRLSGLALLPKIQELAMHEKDFNTATVRRGLVEALARQDMLAAAPIRPTPLRSIWSRLEATARSFGDRHFQFATPRSAKSPRVTTPGNESSPQTIAGRGFRA